MREFFRILYFIVAILINCRQ